MIILELFNGIGGIHTALIDTEYPFSTSDFYELNTAALNIFKYNYPNYSEYGAKNIMGLTVNIFEKLAPDLITMSPPCQPFTRQGLKKDIKDTRCNPLLHILSIIEQSSVLPKMLFLENVAGFETSDAHARLIEVLNIRKYAYQEFLLSPSDFGIPNSRLRYYLIAKQLPFNFCFHLTSQISYTFPVCTCLVNELDTSNQSKNCSKCKLLIINKIRNIITNRFKKLSKINSQIKLCDIKLPLSDFFENLKDPSKYIVPEKNLFKYATVFDIVITKSIGSCCFTKGYGHYVKGTGSVIQHNEEIDLNKIYSEIIDLNDEITREKLLSLKLRYFTPSEMLKLMCFPDTFKIPENTSNREAFKAIGNSVNVFIVSILLLILFE